jgi:hypothetical protein
VRRLAVIFGALLACFGVLAATAQARSAGPLSLLVNFDYNGQITVTLPDGTPVGTTSGAPTVIPAGYYVLTLTQPGCIVIPAFVLLGPGVNIQDDLQSGEIVSDADEADFQPNSTYQWRNGSINPPLNFTFQTSGSVVGTPPVPAAAAAVSTGSNKAETNSDPLASTKPSTPSVVSRGALNAFVSSTGKVSLDAHAARVTKLAAGRYTISVNDESHSLGLVLGSTVSGATRALTSAAFTGHRSIVVVLAAGRWFVAPAAGGAKSYFVVTGAT